MDQPSSNSQNENSKNKVSRRNLIKGAVGASVAASVGQSAKADNDKSKLNNNFTKIR